MDIFDKLREHSRYVEKTVRKIETDLSNLHFSSASDGNIDEICNLNLSIEQEIDELLKSTQEANKEAVTVKEEIEEGVSILTKQLDYLEEYFNLKPIEKADNSVIEIADNSIQIIVHEPEEELIKDDVKENTQPVIMDDATRLLYELEMKGQEKIVSPPNIGYSQVVERELAMLKKFGDITYHKK